MTWTTSRPFVPLTVTVSGWASPVPPNALRSMSTVRDVGAGEVVDGDRVGAAEGVEADAVDVVEIHDDVGDVAGEPDPAAVGGDLDDLADVAAEEVEQVVAALALDGVVAVAGVPLEAVVAGAEERAVLRPGCRRRSRCRCRRGGGRRRCRRAGRRRRRRRRSVSCVSAARLPTAVIVSAPSRPSTTRLSTAVVSSRAASGANVLTSVPLANTSIGSSRPCRCSA